MKMNFNRTKLGGVILVLTMMSLSRSEKLLSQPVTDISTQARVYYQENANLGTSQGEIYFENVVNSIFVDETMMDSSCGKFVEEIPFADFPYTNNMTITPILTGVAEDGSASLDIVIILRHILGITPITNPWNLISADVTDDDVIDTNDIELLRDVILAIEDEFERPVWEWPPGWVTVDNWTSFNANPFPYFYYSFPYNNLSTTTVTSQIPKYFYFKATKVGDVTASNSYLCPGVNDLASNILASRSFSKWSDVQVERKEKVIVNIAITPDEDLVSLQIPIEYSQDDLELVSVKFKDGSPLMGYGYNKRKEQLVLLHYLSSTLPFIDAFEKKEITLVFEAKRKIVDIHSAINWSSKSDLEFGGNDLDYINGEAEMEIVSIIPNEISGKILGVGYGNQQLELKLPTKEKVLVEVYNVSGQLMDSKYHELTSGYNYVDVPELNQAGMFFMSAVLYGERYTYKFIRH